MKLQRSSRSVWLESLQQPTVWWRAATLGVTAGLLQAALNQGDRWLSHSVDKAVFLKTVLSLLISFTLVLISSAITWVQRSLERDNT
jgi:H+/Cl- antiporter ClcA